ncbi:MAG: glycoside hydrolase family 9 protein, partial [Bacteroidales bacterium]|nr:glycoside hydrolase family 9 protein [Bacteroidales bacterium]
YVLEIPLTGEEITIDFTPEELKNWEKSPVIEYSQMGYHQKQRKVAILELDERTKNLQEAVLFNYKINGEKKEVLRKMPKEWGKYLRYQYATFDFSEINKEGTYYIQYQDEVAGPFNIAESALKKNNWELSLNTFLPVQMCHMRVQDRGNLWHNACHLDDGLQAKAPLPFFDGFYQSNETETSFAPESTIPGFNKGGWHDAGDDDVNTGSSGKATYHLSMIENEFDLAYDNTEFDFSKKEVFIGKPDGKRDVIQQLMHGVDFLLGQYTALDHSVVGVISNNWETYTMAGDWGSYTDNLFFSPSLNEEQKNATHSGRKDDRLIFTNKDTNREYFVAAILSSSYRALKKYDKALANKCLEQAKTIWQREQNSKPKFYPSVGTPTNLVVESTNAAVELFISTSDTSYLNVLIANQDSLMKNFESLAWSVSRVVDQIKDEKFQAKWQKELSSYSNKLKIQLAENPFGVILDKQVWGLGWNILWRTYKHYYLIKKYPELFPPEQLFNAIEYINGRHPGSNHTLISGVGTKSLLVAFGINREHYSSIPGGLYSGTAMIQPDFPELKDHHPFLWQQSEYIVFGATPYIFCTLGAQRLVDEGYLE